MNGLMIIIRLVALLLISLTAQADNKISIAILDFELKDMTLAPGIPAELERTASIKPLFEKQLGDSGYQLISISATDQEYANSGVGYLFDHHDAAARLGQQNGADYIIVGRLHKPSFLFAYLIAHLIEVKSGRLIGNYVSEAKGPQQKMTEKAVESLMVKINNTLLKK